MRPNQPLHPPRWAVDGLLFYPLSHFLREWFGRRVWKISIDAGLSCPNLDGTLAHDGCVFCDAPSFSPSRRLGGAAHCVAEQIADGSSRLRRRYGEDSADTFLAYFQPATNTYGPLDRLQALWREALNQPGVVGLAIGTRPDCVDNAVLDVLQKLTEDTWVSIEFGLQSIHQESLDWLRRGHDFACFEDAVGRAHDRGLHVGAHLILGLPGETPRQNIETAEAMARLRVDAVKLHNLYVVRDTPLATLWEAGKIRLPDRNEYTRLVVDFLERLPTDCVVDRIVGDAPPEFLLAPDWCRRKAELRNAVELEFRSRGTRQGSCWSP